ncbi:hypothetical protein KUG47_09520 [Falsochrobactrum sp. TDYN1]|uniref:Uncharacterized protein n=1 Tax=Falsochrobactrum tianjinense TaxID=2706015 RepID=A0A949PLZ4_9HYPH|nr:hypothetical protein [Falsochrobactrum sp. TDYN1]MBV2143736.1 hypothetical protein [Falsochrobactrum sp. TDYN1]
MTESSEPRVRELTSAEIEALRKEMHEAIEWAQAELARQRRHMENKVVKA